MQLVALTAKWLLDSALAAAVVLTLGALLLRLVRQPARRQRLGEWALVGCLLVAFLAGMPGLPRWSLGVVDPALLGPRMTAGDMRGIEAFDLATLPGASTSLTRPGRPTGTVAGANSTAHSAFSIGPTLVLILVGLYGLAVASALVRLVGGLWTLHRLRRAGSPPGPALAALWRELAGDLPRPPLLLTSRTLTEPLSFGLLRPTVLIPESFARTGDTDALRVVLTHELVHVRRRDAWTWLLAALVQVLFFYQPAYWWLRRELRLAQEFIADAWAAQRAPSAHHYAACLLQLLGRPTQPLPAEASPILGGRSQFYRRLERLLHQNPPATDRHCGFTWTWLCGLLVLLVALGAGNLTLRAREPAAAQNSKPDPYHLELRGVRYLLSQQSPTGGWLEQVGPAPTALVLKSLLQ
ncbi:MAG: M56 family metallopeptidase, partial [Phycisphaerae bacterium]